MYENDITSRTVLEVRCTWENGGSLRVWGMEILEIIEGPSKMPAGQRTTRRHSDSIMINDVSRCYFANLDQDFR